MTCILTTTWDPRGELGRLQRFYPQLQALYSGIVIVMPAHADADVIAAARLLPGAQIETVESWPSGRWACLKAALDLPGEIIQYADMDRLLRWIETLPEELAQTVAQLPEADFTIIGRTAAAFATHPQCMQLPEAALNAAFESWFGFAVDLPSGSKGISRKAGQYLLAHTLPANGLGTDAEWASLLFRADYKLNTLWVDGLDWETADRYRDTAADSETQRMAADLYDTDVSHWHYRASLNLEIMRAGLAALSRTTEQTQGKLP